MQQDNRNLCDYQSAWIADHSPVKIWEKSRRIGASWVEALYSVLAGAKKRADGGTSTYYLSYNKDMTRQFVRDCAWWAGVIGIAIGRIEELVDDADKDITSFRIRFASGNEICALPSEPRSLRSKQGRVVIDEAAFVDDLAELLKAALALLMWGGQVSVLSTHNGVENPFNELIEDVRRGKFDYSLHRTDLDDALQGGLFRAICRRAGTAFSPKAEAAWRSAIVARYGDAAEEELFCVPRRSEGTYLTAALIEGCMDASVPVLRWTAPADDFVDWDEARAEEHTRAWLEAHVRPIADLLPPDLHHYLGGDFGRTGDLSAFWPGTETVDLRLAVPFAVELRNCPHRTQKQILFYIVDHLPRFAGLALDARGNGSWLAEAARQEYGPALVLEVMITEGWYRGVMPKVKSRLEDRATVLPRDAHVLNDFRTLRVVNGVARVPDQRGRDASGNRHGDSAVAYAMLVHAREELGGIEPWDCVTGGMPEADRLLAGF